MSFADFNNGGGRKPIPVKNNQLELESFAAAPAKRSTADNNFTAVSNLVLQDINSIAQNISAIQRLVSLIGTDKDSHDVRARMHDQLEATKDLVKSVSIQLKNMTPIVTTDSQKRAYHKLSSDFSKLIDQFKDLAKRVHDKDKEIHPPQKKSNNFSNGGSVNEPMRFSRTPGPAPYPEFDNDEQDNNAAIVAAQKRQQLMTVHNDRVFNDALINERDDAIVEIEKTVTEINEIFRDIAVLVNDQGQMIDSIESHVEDASKKTSTAVVELRKAHEHQKSSRTKMCIFIFVILVLLGVVTSVLVLVLKK